MKRALSTIVLCTAAMAATATLAAPLTPQSDAEVVERLSADSAARRQQREQRRALARSPRDPAVAVAAARAYLDLARRHGDARAAGLALGALRAWDDKADAPADVIVMQATLAQYLHDFAEAERLLQRALALAPRHPQALLTAATIARVRGDLAASDARCQVLRASGQRLHGDACLAENASLRGDHDAARAEFERLLQAAPDAARAWLATSLAELEQRAGRGDAARAAWQRALALAPGGYARMAYADFLLEQGDPTAVVALLERDADNDAALLRLAIAGRNVGDARAAAWRRDLAARIAAARERPGAAATHAREQARFALDVQGDPRRALALARTNLELQREPADLLLLARVAAALPEREQRVARAELRQWQQRTGIHDARLE